MENNDYKLKNKYKRKIQKDDVYLSVSMYYNSTLIE